MSENKIDWSRPVMTRDGRKVRILCTDAKSTYCIIGLVDKDGKEHVATWTLEGKQWETKTQPNNEDLVNVPERIERDVWVNVYDDGQIAFFSKENADAVDSRNSSDPRLACVKIHISCLKGEGLEGK